MRALVILNCIAVVAICIGVLLYLLGWRPLVGIGS